MEHGCYLVSWDFTRGKDKCIVLVGNKSKDGKDIDIANAFEGNEAFELIKQLSGKNNI